MAAFCMLLLISYVDIQIRQVPVSLLVLSGVAAGVHHLTVREIEPLILLGGAAVGFFFLLISKVTEEGLGYGDSWGILILGIYLGLWELLGVLCVTFLFLLIFAIAALCIRKMSRSCTLPFFPFLTGGYLVTILIGGGIL